MRIHLVLGVFLLVAGIGVIVLGALRPGPALNAAPPMLAPTAWRWAHEDETADVYIPAPEYGRGAQRGIAAWRLTTGGGERRDSEIEWVRVPSPQGGYWLPGRSDLEVDRIVVFDGFEVHMGPVPASGRVIGMIAPGLR